MTFERLPYSIRPREYLIELVTNFETFVFDGTTRIQVDVLEPSDQIKLNSAELSIDSVKVNGIKATSWEVDSEKEELTITPNNPLEPGPATIDIVYTGVNNDKLKGFYRTKKLDQDNKPVYSLATQLCATDARRVFPCWDEPDRKAIFELTLTIPTGRTALSNMPVKSHEVLEGQQQEKFVFEPTLKMSTYLLAFCVGTYDYVETHSSSGIRLRVYTEKGESEQGRFALEVASKSLDFYEDYFNIKYPMAKCDMIAVADFKFGAMENWGLITYRSVAVLFDEAKSSIKRKQYVAYVVCHELAHQWFGNLVTMGWWTHLWLNEGFATFMGYLCTDHIHPEWHVWDQFMASGILGALNLDALDSSHPIEVPVGHPSETDEIFDAISYNKGCAIIRMLHNWISDACFRIGMENYLNKFAYANAQTEDLWEALGNAAGKPVAAVMDKWTSQVGYPVVAVKVLNRSDTTITLSLSQSKFCATSGNTTTPNQLWSVPISIQTMEKGLTNQVKTIIMSEESTQVEVDLSRTGWLKINENFTNWHLVEYDESLLEPIIANMSVLNSLNRLNIAFEVIALAKAGIYPVTNYLDLLDKSFGTETSYSMWSEASRNIGLIGRLCSELDCSDQFSSFLAPVINRAVAALDAEVAGSDATNSKLLHALLFAQLAAVNNESTISWCVDEVNNALSNKDYSLDADLAMTMLSVFAEQTNDIQSLIDLHSRMTMTDQKNQIEVAIGAVASAEKQRCAINFIMGESVRNQDKSSALVAMASNGKSQRNLVLEYTLDNIDKIKEIFDGVDIGRYLKGLLGKFVTKNDHQRIAEYFGEHPINNAERSINQGLEDIKVHANMLERDGEQIKQFLASKLSQI